MSELAPIAPSTELVVVVDAPADEAHPVAVYLAGLSPGSRPVMLSALRSAAGLLSSGQLEDVKAFPWSELRYPHLVALRALLQERYAPATANRLLCAVRGVLREAWRLGQLSTDDYQRARDVGGVRGTRLPVGRDLAMSERQRLLELCANDPLPARGARDAAMIAILSGTGVRRAEVVGLDLADVELDSGAVRVLGKGDKERRTYLVDGALRAFQWWLSLRGTEDGPLLTRVLRGGHIRIRRLQPRAVAVVIERRIREAGLRAATAHDFRRTLTGDLLDAGADLATVQAILGHASPTTTARYDRRSERTRKRALELLTVPFAGAGSAAPASSVEEEREPERVASPGPTSEPSPPVAPSRAAHAKIRVRLVGTKVWRRLRLPLSSTFEELHLLIQEAFGWDNFHLYHFGPIASHSMLEGPSASAVKVGDYLGRRGDVCGYEYDLGDRWLHELRVQAIEERADADAWVLAGGGTTPPEDCGGVPGFRHLRKLLRGRRMPREAREQFGSWDSDGFDRKSLPRRVVSSSYS